MRNFLAALAVVFMILPASNAIAAPLEARIDLSSQTMVVKKNGKVRYKWKISSGRKGYSTPTGRWSAKWLSKHHRSRITMHQCHMQYSSMVDMLCMEQMRFHVLAVLHHMAAFVYILTMPRNSIILSSAQA